MKFETNSRKILAIAITSLLVVALCLGAVFAWRDFSQSFSNVLRGGASNDVLLHDDFQPWEHKDVYVENPGDQSVIVRVKFKEFFQIGNKVIRGQDPSDKSTYEVHLFGGEATPATTSGGMTFTRDLEPEDCEYETHDYFKWEMTGESKIYLHGTSELGWRDYSSKTPEERDPTTGMVTLEGDVGGNGLHFAETLETIPIMTIEQWMESDGDVACWVLDTDGWAYWSQALPPGYATNRLLSNVEKIKTPSDNWNYNIDVVMQATNLHEAHEMYDQGTVDDATQEAIDYIINRIVNLARGSSEKLKSLQVGDHYVDNKGVEWIVVDKLNDDLLITTAQIYNAAPPDISNFVLYENSPEYPEMQSWYQANVGSDIKAVARGYEYPSGTKGQVGDGIEYGYNGTLQPLANTTNVTRARTKPAGMIGGGRVFPASVSEANGAQYFFSGGDASRTESNPTIPFLGWYLRSPGSGTTSTRSYVDVNGVIHAN